MPKTNRILVIVTNDVRLSGSEHLTAGKELTGFSWDEEVKAGGPSPTPRSSVHRGRDAGVVTQRREVMAEPDRDPLILLPDLLCDAAVWARQALADLADVTVADLTQDDTVRAMAARMLALAPPRFALAALSMGGYVAFEVMRQAPGRVTRLALLDTSAGPDSEESAAQRRAGIESVLHGRFAGVTSHLLPQIVHPSRVAGPVGEELKAMAARVGRQGNRTKNGQFLADGLTVARAA